MSFIRTVLGDIRPDQLGVCYAHEHIIIDSSYTTAKNPEFHLGSVDKAVAELKQFYADGGRSMIDSMPCDSGRNIRKLAAISRQSKVHIVAPTGLHLPIYYDPGHWSHFYDESTLAELFIADINEGIDAHDYNGPVVDRTPHQAGIIKVATGAKITDRERRAFAAASRAHRETGCPILTHTEQGKLGLEQIEMLQEGGVDLSHVVLSHTDRSPDIGYHREMLSTGTCLEYDSAFRWKPKQGNPTLDLVAALLPEYPDQIFLGMDAARASYWISYGGQPGLSFLLTNFKSDMQRKGIEDSLIQKCFVTGPSKAYSFA